MLDKLQKSRFKNRIRVGRGPGSKGKTAGRGHKGQKSRSGAKISALFEGGQSNYVLRTPKRGFRNYNKVTYDVVNVGLINKLKDLEKVDADTLVKFKIISGKNPLKILGNGELNKKLEVSANSFSESAASKIKSAGGNVIKV